MWYSVIAALGVGEWTCGWWWWSALVCGVVLRHGLHQQRVPCIKRSEVVEIAVELFGVLPLLLVWVLFDADNEGIDCDQDGENTSENGLHNDEHHASDGLSCLTDTKLFHEDQDANNRRHSNDLNEDVDPASTPKLIRPSPEQKSQHDSLDD